MPLMAAQQVAVIADDEDPGRRGQADPAAALVDLRAQAVQRHALVTGDALQRVPHLRLEPHVGSTARHRDVTALQDRRLVFPPGQEALIILAWGDVRLVASPLVSNAKAPSKSQQ